ncbi:hypothetical protein ABFS83_12G026900 [Erythranthe nasuta]
MKKGSFGGWLVLAVAIVVVVVAAETNCNPAEVLTACSDLVGSREVCCREVMNLVDGPCYCDLFTSTEGRRTATLLFRENAFTICGVQPQLNCTIF